MLMKCSKLELGFTCWITCFSQSTPFELMRGAGYSRGEFS